MARIWRLPSPAPSMKIFNWVHRKFHPKDGFEQNGKKQPKETETQVLLQHEVTLADLVDGWREGLLTIGTFGFDPFTQFDQNIVCQVVEKEDESCDDEEYGVDYEFDYENDSKGLDEEELDPLVSAAFGDENDHVYEMGFESKDSEDERWNKKRERITLADLFSADSEVSAKGDCCKMKPDYSKKSDLHLQSKKGLSFAKKLIPRVGDDKRPIKKLHQLMSKMLKRKIHPDLEAEMQKTPIVPTICGLLPPQDGPNESVSLLQSKGILLIMAQISIILAPKRFNFQVDTIQ
ncbi:NAD-dependent protein deacetylase HST1-like protein [Actinidia rufa]|uniref:Protein TILLER ANGLE CONTROL 1 n=1 Tax=Actinidia rufa TaxID=165716 RepID=A0A7J0F4C1_9ERIC|nr:NAD-dependent protein deacetylase HST1-like protein [Actinidia rufa]